MHVYTCKVSPYSPANPQVPSFVRTLEEHPETDNGVLDAIIRYIKYTSSVSGEFDIAHKYPACIVCTAEGNCVANVFRFKTLQAAIMGALGMGSKAQAVLFFEKQPGNPSRIFTHTLTVIKFGEEITWNLS